MRKLDKLPEGEIKIIGKKRLVLAHGESGHSHVIEDDEAELIQIGERIIARLSKNQTVKHEEHNSPNSLIPEPKILEAGLWEVGRILEFDYFQQMQRQVMD